MADIQALAILKTGKEKWNAWRLYHPQDSIDLRGAVLSAENLADWNYEGVNLRNADLTGAEIFRLNLTDADFRDCRLEKAYFAKADLSRADFTGSILRNSTIKVTATFESAKFRHADLSGLKCQPSYYSQSLIDFRNVDLTSALLNDVDLTWFNLSGATGISQATGCFDAIPAVWVAESAKDPVDPEVKYFSSFISYSRQDKRFAETIYNHLTARGVKCWLDEHDIAAGADICNVIYDGIHGHDRVILCCSKSAIDSWWVDVEVSLALQKEQEIWKSTDKKPYIVIAVDLDGSLLRSASGSGKLAIIKTRRCVEDLVGWETDARKLSTAVDRICMALCVAGRS